MQERIMRKRYIAVVLFLLLVLVAWFMLNHESQDAPPAAPTTSGAAATSPPRETGERIRNAEIRVKIQVRDTTEAGVPDAVLTILEAESRALLLEATTDASGTYDGGVTLGLVQGASAATLMVAAHAEGYASGETVVEALVSEMNEVVVVLNPLPGAINGVLMDRQGRRLPGYGVGLTTPGELRFGGGAFADSREHGEITVTGEGGYFALRDVKPGAYTFDVGPTTGPYLNLLGNDTPEVAVGPGETVEGVQLIIEPADSGLGGFVVDEQGMALDGVRIESLSGDSDVTDENGRFDFYHVPTALKTLPLRFERAGYETQSPRVVLETGVFDHVVEMRALEMLTKYVIARVLDGKTMVPINDAEVQMPDGVWKPTRGGVLDFELRYIDSLRAGEGAGFRARAVGYLPGSRSTNFNSVNDGDTLDVLLFRGTRELVVSARFEDKFLSFVRESAGSDVRAEDLLRNKVKLYSSFANIPGQSVSTTRADRSFVVNAVPGEAVDCTLNMLNFPLNPDGSVQSIYLNATVKVFPGDEPVSAEFRFGKGTNMLTVRHAGLRGVLLTQEGAAGLFSAGQDAAVISVRDRRMAGAREEQVTFAFLGTGTYLVSCNYIDESGNSKTVEDVYAFSGENQHGELAWDIAR